MFQYRLHAGDDRGTKIGAAIEDERQRPGGEGEHHQHEEVPGLELEADSGVRPRDIADKNSDFDSLEMDRYSRVQQLSRGLAESLSDLESIRELLDGIAGESDAILSEQSRVSRDLHQGRLGCWHWGSGCGKVLVASSQ